MVDSLVYDLSKFYQLHPGGIGVLLDSKIGETTDSNDNKGTLIFQFLAGKDATDGFFSLHRAEVLERPAYKRLIIGRISSAKLKPALPIDSLSTVPYGEAMWLSDGFHSAYHTESHRKFQKVVRGFMRSVVLPDALACEENGKRASQHVFDALA